jgi:hypothetical protein
VSEGGPSKSAPNRLDYSKGDATFPTNAITVTDFADGGVTVIVPRYQPRDELLSDLKVFAGALAAVWMAATLVGAICGVGWPLIRNPSAMTLGRVTSMLWSIAHVLFWPMVLVFAPGIIFGVWITTQHISNRPTIIGISPKRVFVEKPGWFVRRKYTLRRTILRRVEVLKSSDGQRCFIVLQFKNRMPIYACNGWPLKELDFVSVKLNQAISATEPANATG